MTNDRLLKTNQSVTLIINVIIDDAHEKESVPIWMKKRIIIKKLSCSLLWR